jgi:ABC-type transport system substrate-binding protein
MKTKKFLVLALLAILTLVVSACAPAAGVPGAAPAAPAAGEEAAVSGDEFSTPHPILSDVNIRKAIAHCIDRDALIASVYVYVDDPEALRMDSWAPKTSWPYSGPYDFPDYDPAAAAALLDEAGWTLADGASVRTNADGDVLSLKFTTTNAPFRQTWSAVMIQQLAECGIQIIPTYAPGSWWFGDTTGLARRDFELGAYAWVGQAEPAGRTLYACSQIPTPSNNWEGQNYMGWCNETASNAVIRATNTLVREERIPAYDILQEEFAKDVVSIPLFQRAEAEAWSTNLTGPDPDATEYTTWNLNEWTLADGGDTIVIGMTQEPDSMWSPVSSMAASRLVRMATGDTGGGGGGRTYLQRNYDFQPWFFQEQLSTLEAGLATNSDVEVAAGDMVYSLDGEPVTLEAGVTVFDNTATEVEYDGSSPLTMKQLVVTYPFKNFTWSDGTPGSIADFELAYKIDCDQTGGATSYITCESIQDVEFSADALEYTVTYLPGVQDPTYFIPPIGVYPSHQVLSDGRNLADVPAAEWATLPEIAETPLTWGPYMITEWVKGQSLTLAANPYFDGEVATPNAIFVFVADGNQAVAQLLNGDVDFLDDSTLGAGAEVQTVIDAANGGAPVQYEISGSPTWEHLDINLYTK